MLSRTLVASLSCVALARGAVAQTVWTVTSPSGVQAAIQGAAPGDVIELVGSLFQAFTVDKGVSIRGNGAVVGPGTLTANVPGGQVAHIDQVGTYSLAVQGGSVRLERCLLSRVTAVQADLVIADSTIAPNPFTPTGLPRPMAGLEVSSSALSLRDCSVTGSDAGWYSPGPTWFGPSPALVVNSNSGSVHAERCAFTSGAGGAMGTIVGAPLAAVALPWNVPGFFADCTLQGGAGFGSVPGAPATHGGGTFEFRDTVLTTGAPNSTSVTTTNAPLVSLELSAPWTRGATSVLTIEGSPTDLHAVFVTPATATSGIGLVVEPVLLGGEFVVRVGLLDAAGLASHPVAVPNVPALQHVPVWCQAVAGVALPLRGSVIAGGLVR